ncbi:HWE histidine kinase domain-containing protein [Jiella sp. M17.18]|uniref:HWE histidine kinase domain-containing protein n=1 Tax=Jiella sp. M17.18 TaxID=3234247 RepID=UPI0034DFF197
MLLSETDGGRGRLSRALKPFRAAGSGSARTLIVFSLCGLCTILALTALFAWVNWLQIVDRTRSETRASAFFLSEHAEQIFKVADLALGRAIATVGDTPWNEAEGSRQLHDRLRAIRSDIPYITDLWLNDANGDLRATSYAFPTPKSNAADRASFRAQLRPGSSLYVGESTVGRVTGARTFLVSRRIEDASGGFRGVALATVDLNYFNDLWKRLTLPPGMRVSLVRGEDLSILAAYPDGTSQLSDVPAFAAVVAGRPREGIYRFEGKEGERLGAYRRVADLPIFVRVTQSHAAMLRAWLNSMLFYAPFSLIGLAALAALAWFAGRLARSEERSRQELNDAVDARTAELAEQTRLLDKLNATGRLIAAELDIQSVVRAVVDAATELSGAAYGAFFYLKTGPNGERLRLHVLSGASAEDFAAFADPRDTAVFAPTFNGRETVRSDDIVKDPRYGGKIAGQPDGGGMPAGHLPVRSYLAVPVVSRSGEVHGAILLGHPAIARFGDRQEELAVSLAAQAAVALDNARLFEAAQEEIEGRRRAEERQKLLIRELNHRVKNMLATVKAVLRLTSRSTNNIHDFMETFSARINSLAMTHAILTDSVRQTADLERILSNELAPYAGAGGDDRAAAEGRIALEGPPVVLSSETAVPFGMAVHELATNAAKHGALSASTGRLRVTWRIVDDAPEAGSRSGEAAVATRQVQLDWVESDGPPVSPPSRGGFGSQLLDRVIRMQLQGAYETSHPAEGFRMSMKIPVSA